MVTRFNIEPSDYHILGNLQFLDEKKLDSELDNGQYIPIGKGVAADP